MIHHVERVCHSSPLYFLQIRSSIIRYTNILLKWWRSGLTQVGAYQDCRAVTSSVSIFALKFFHFLSTAHAVSYKVASIILSFNHSTWPLHVYCVYIHFKTNLQIYRLYLCSISSAETPPSCMDLLVAALTADIVVARNALSCYKSKIMNDSIELELINQSIHTTLNKVNINIHSMCCELTLFPMPRLPQWLYLQAMLHHPLTNLDASQFAIPSQLHP